jgi:NAD(P)H dehydrogenase (quinone)
LTEQTASSQGDIDVTHETTIAVTGATGELGRIVTRLLRERHPDIKVVALVRNLAKADVLAGLGAELRAFDYDQPATLQPALAGVDTLLLISGNAVGERERQHRAVIEAASAAGVGLIAYTSVLRASETALPIAAEHKATESILRDAAIPYVLLRHGWYLENYAFRVQVAVGNGALVNCAGDGRISAAARRDYAEAAVAILTSTESQAGKVYELAGSSSFTFADMAAEIARASGGPVAAVDLPKPEFEAAMVAIGLPPFVAALIAKSDYGAREGGLFDDSRTLERIIGREPTPLSQMIGATLAQG